MTVTTNNRSIGIPCSSGIATEQNRILDAVVDSNNSEALVRERTIPTDRPPLVGEI
jgi:hypothetical protein